MAIKVKMMQDSTNKLGVYEIGLDESMSGTPLAGDSLTSFVCHDLRYTLLPFWSTRDASWSGDLIGLQRTGPDL